MRIPAEAGVEPRHLLMHHGVARDAFAEFLVLRRRRQLGVEQEIARLHEGALLGELVDWITAIEEHTLVAVDKGNLGFARRRRGKAGIVSEATGLGIKRADIDDVGAERPFQHWEVALNAVDADRSVGRLWLGGEAFCNAHREAPMTTGEGLGTALCSRPHPRELVFAVPHIRANSTAAQHRCMPKY